MKEEIDIRDTDLQSHTFWTKEGRNDGQSGICWFVEKGVLEINNLVEL